MVNNGLSKEDLGVILSGYRQRNLSEFVMEMAEKDLTSGLSKSQVDLYANRRYSDAGVKGMSEALHMGASAKLVRKLANLDEYRSKIVLEEIRGGMSEDKILHVLSKDATAHGMQQLFSQIKEDMTNTKEEKEPDKNQNSAEQTDNGKCDRQNEASRSEYAAYRPEDIAKAMEPMFLKFTEGLTKALKPNLEYMNRVADSMNEMQSRFAEDKDREQENRFNQELDRLERQVKELQSDLASSAGVIRSKETEIGRLREEMAKMKDGPEEKKTGAGEQKPAVNRSSYVGDGNVGSTVSAGSIPVGTHRTMEETVYSSRFATADRRHKTEDGTGHLPVSATKKKSMITGNCQTVLRTADGREIPIQIERTEARRTKGMMAMAAKLFGGTQSQKALLNMLIDKRLTPEQLKEIKRAKDSHFSEDELTDLIESDLPAEEMAGIIDVIISDRG